MIRNMKAYQKAWYKTHKKRHNKLSKIRYNKYMREWLQLRKREVLAYYSNGELRCRVCHIADIDVLCLDHINNDGYKHRRPNSKHGTGRGAKILGSQLYQWAITNNYPPIFQVLCMNCNWKKHLLNNKEKRST